MRGKIAAIATIAMLSACPGKGPKGNGGGDGDGDGGGGRTAHNERCAKLSSHLEQLYAATTPKDKPELAADLRAANVEMVMTDCREEPDRVAPCVEKATSADEIESKCLIPLDDDGKVEGRKFGGK